MEEYFTANAVFIQDGKVVCMEPVEDPWESSCGVVLIHYNGKLVGTPPDVQFEGLIDRFYADGDQICEFYVLQFLDSKGVDIDMVRRLFYKTPGETFSELKLVDGDKSFGAMCEVIKDYGGVAIYVEHEVDFAEQVPETIYIGWSEDLNVFGVNGEVVGCGEERREGSVCSWDDFSDSDLGTAVGSDVLHREVVGKRRKDKKKAREEFFGGPGRREFRPEVLAQLVEQDVVCDGPYGEAHDIQEAIRRPNKSKKKKTVRRSFSVKHSSKRIWGKKKVASVEPCRADEGFHYEDREDSGGLGHNETENTEGAEPEIPLTEDNGDGGPPEATEGAEPEIPLTDEQQRELDRKKRHYARVKRYKTLECHVDIDWSRTGEVAGDDIGDSPYMDGQRVSKNTGCSDSSSSEEEEYMRLPVVNDDRSKGAGDLWYSDSWVVPFFQEGMKFEDKFQVRRAVQNYAVKKKAGIRFAKNDNKRIRCKCREGCPWTIQFSPDKGAKCWRVKTYSWEHNCLQLYRNKRASSSYIAGLFHDKVRADPTFTCQQMMIDTFKEHGVAVRYSKCVRAKVKILNELEGNFREKYAKVQGYANFLD